MIYFKKVYHIPVCTKIDNIIYVFLDVRVYKEVLSLVKHLKKLKLEFYFLPTEMANPKGIDESKFYDKIVYNYFYMYIKKEFYYGFKKINFDYYNNLCKYVVKENLQHLLKENYDMILKEVGRNWYDYYRKERYYEYNEDIRNEYKHIWRDIRINLVLNF